MKQLSIVIPAFNEEKNIERSLKAIIQYMELERFNYEIIVINDGSGDKTASIINNFPNVILIDHQKNSGKGHAVRTGILHAKKENILFLDADLSIPIEDVSHALKFTDKYEVIIGSRNLPESKIKSNAPLYRRFMGKTFSYLVKLISGLKVKDSQCGFKLFKKDSAHVIFKRTLINGWCFDVEALILAKKFNFKIKEIPVVLIDHSETSKINPISSSLEMLKDLIKVKMNDWQGKYDV